MIKIRKKKKTKAKPASEAQKKARERNWNKGQILCIKSIANKIYKAKTTTNLERTYLKMIINASTTIHEHWNK